MWTYIASWLLLTVANFLFMFAVNNVGVTESVIDAVIFNTLFAVFGFAIYYVTYYAGLDKRFGYIVLNHFFSALIFVGLWLLISALALNLIYSILGLETLDSPAWLQFKFLQGLFYYVVMALIYYLMRTSEVNRQAKTDLLQLENELKEAQLQTLKSQINPHFLFNSLNSISYLVSTDSTKAREMLSVLSDYFRYSLKNQSKLSSIDDELIHCRKYLEIEQVRFGEKLLIVENIDRSISHLLVPSMILQPLYENAVKHGVYESRTPVTIATHLSDHDDFVKLIIENNYDEESIPRKGEGIGLKNVMQRLEITYGHPNLVTIIRKPDKFVVEIHIPKNIAP